MPTVAAAYEPSEATVAVPQSIWDLFDRGLSLEGSELTRPWHLKPFVELLERALDEEVRSVFAAPPKHFKSSTILAALAFYCLAKSGHSHMYVTYNQTRSDKVKAQFEHLLRQLGVRFRARNNSVHVGGGSVAGGTSILFTTTKGSATGDPCTGIAIVDDPVKDNVEANSTVSRDKDYGIDLAYAGKKKSDWNVVFRLLENKATGRIHVDRVIRRQCKLEPFLPHVQPCIRHPHEDGPLRANGSGEDLQHLLVS